MISESDFAELIFNHVLTDHVTFHRLAQINKKFNEVSKRKLIRKEVTFAAWFDDSNRMVWTGRGNVKKIVWTEQANGKKHGLCRTWVNGKLLKSIHYQDDQLHGHYQSWYPDGTKMCHYIYESNRIIQVSHI